MLKSKKILIYLLILVLILIQFSTICLATSTPVTDENLSEVLQKFTSSDANEDNYSITVSNNSINLSTNNETYTLKYDLSNKPTFSFEIPIEKGMSYDDFKKQTDKIMLPMIGYVAVANIQGVAFEDANDYFLGCALNGSFSLDSNNAYMIIDDTIEGVTIESDNTNAIKVSEFGERVMEYVNAVYSESQSISDIEEINSFNLTVERKDITDTTCKLVSTLSVNLDADFSKISENTQQTDNSFMIIGITKENADLVVNLKVGQKCKIESTEKITGYVLAGEYCVEVNDDKNELTGTKVGMRNGYLYIGEEQKTIYITVEENTNNDILETITLKIESSSGNSATNTEEIKQESEKTTLEDNAVVSSELPQTGLNNVIVFIIIVLIVLVILIRIILRKYNDVR